MDEFLRIIGFDWQLIHDVALTAINVLILFFALSYLLFDPARAFLEKRRQKIAGELAEAAEDKKTAQELKAEYESRIKEIEREADAILADARKKAMIKEADILDEARAEAARIVERAERQVELERKKALDDMKQEIVSIASLMAGKVVAGSMDVKIQDSLIDETLKEMGESTWLS